MFKSENTHPLYLTIIPMGKSALDYARSSETRRLHKMRPHCTEIHAPAALPPTKHNKCTTSVRVHVNRNRRNRKVHKTKRSTCRRFSLLAAGSIKGTLITTNANTLCFRRKGKKIQEKNNKNQNSSLQEIFNFAVVRQLISLLRNVRSAHALLTRMFKIP